MKMINNILVTGGTGYLGQAVVSQLHQSKVPFCYTYRSQSLPDTQEQGLRLDLLQSEDYVKYQARLDEVDCLVHIAATVSHDKGADVSQQIHAQITESFIIFENLLAHLPNLKRIVYVSSCSAEIARETADFYGLGKLFMEQTLEHIPLQKDLSYCNLRFPQLYGMGEPHGTFVTKFITMLEEGQEITLVNNGKVIRDILYVKDAAASVVHAAMSSKQGGYTVTHPNSCTVQDVLEILTKITGKEARINHVSQPEADIAKVSFHFESSVDKLGYTLQYSLEDGLKETIDDWRKA